MSPLTPFVDHLGELRFLGHVPPTFARKAARYADAAGLIPESDWVEVDEWPAEVKIKDQDGKGACNGHACATGVELDRAVQGKQHVDLSAWYVYAILCGGRDVGSSIGDALDLIRVKGVAPESDVPYGLITPSRLTSQAHTDAARFRAEIGAAVSSPEEIVTAVLRREPLNISICVGAGFDNLDSDGVARLGWGMDNHAVCCFGGLKKTARHGWCVKIANSWGTSWGLNGFFWLPVDKLAKGGSFEGYVLKSVADDPQDPTNPPKLA